jgi:septum formation protein
METKQKLILASTSPRRVELLKGAGLVFEVLRPDADEKMHAGETPVEYAVRTAREKAESIPMHSGTIILGADTVVAAEGRILGKPADAQDARAMLRLLSGKMHEVVTGVCLRSAEKTVCFHVATAVLFRELSDEEIAAYVATGDPFDKAGAYAIQNGAAGMVRRIDGSYSNVVGLPLCEVVEALSGFAAVKSQMSESRTSESVVRSAAGLSDLRP